ncbi:hypothetical protein HDV05_001265 [Chytridiales sp. JEL 0842]|nr:hypothetical protein HDV05_001265 [Chytridiales sp. JEL 0842]
MPLVQQLSVGGEFSGSTESREKFVKHQMPKYALPKKEPWVGNNSTFDATTTQRTDFPVWPVSAPKPKEKVQWVSSSGKFDGQTTNKADFRDLGLQPRFHKEPLKYVPSDSKFEGTSSHAADYKNWPITSRPKGRQYAPYLPVSDDRDFKSTTTAAYVGHPILEKSTPRQLPQFTPSNTKFEGVTTSKDAYQKWTVPPRPRREKVQWVPNASEFVSSTTYSDNYVPKTIERSIEATPRSLPGQHVVMNSSKFEGISTHKSDFLPTGKVEKCPDFRPQNAYRPMKDDRDFLTTNRSSHDTKPIAPCPAVKLMQYASYGDDGHCYVKQPMAVDAK